MKYFAILMGLFLFSNIDAKQKYYKWTDADGNTHYSEKKPFNKKTAEVKVSTHQPTVISHPDENDGDDSTSNNDDEKSPEQKAVDEYNKNEQARVSAVQNQENCKIAKKNYATLQDTVRIRQKNPATGEYIRMDDKQRVLMMKNAKQAISELCK